MLKVKQNKKRGQTALEYALVIGVITLGVVMAGRAVFSDKDSAAHNLMKKAVTEATETITKPGE